MHRPLPRDNRLLALPRYDTARLPLPDLLVDETQSRIDAHRRHVTGHEKLSPLRYAAGLGSVHLIGSLGTRIPDMPTQRDGCGRSPLDVAVVMNDALR